MKIVVQFALLALLAFAILGIFTESHAIKFRENVKPGDRCSFWLEGDWCPGEIIGINDEIVTLTYMGEVYTRPLNEIEPLFPL